ncbi:hypothetical protein BU16DRAFT_622934 [Lophium mytilinum]|uniref:C2H2-type domain-containing protein n=1 Tax=Lophium mytilinum TaxID=390894 RepID=A0A6A6QAK8_9PEZI|nr:hypothetical protein BU16DRAFT_622934 [Lophium mytilinum]
MADFSGLSDQEILDGLLNRYTIGELGRLGRHILSIDQSRQNSVHSSRPDSSVSTFSFRSDSSLSGFHPASSASSIQPVRRSCDTSNSNLSVTSQYAHKPHLQYRSPLGSDPALYDPGTQPTGFQPYGANSALPSTSHLSQTQPLLESLTVNIQQPKDTSEQPKRLLFCTFCAEQGIQRTITFKTKSDWKKHETNFHETGYEWRCDVPGCCRIFDRDCDFLRHHQREHPRTPYSTDVKVELPERVAFGCGFKGCKYVSYEWDDRCTHVAKCPFFFAGAHWDYSTKIRNLLRQNSIHAEWKRFLINFCYIYNVDRTELRWTPKTSRTLRQKLECNDIDHLQTFFINAVELGLGRVLVTDAATPRFHATLDEKLSVAQQPHVQYNPTIPLNRSSSVPDQYTYGDTEALLGNTHKITSGLDLQDDTFDHDEIPYSIQNDTLSQHRVSVAMLDVLDVLHEPWPASESIENVDVIAAHNPLQEPTTIKTAFVNPGQPSHPVTEPAYQYADPLTQSRSTPGQRFKKSVKRVKSNLSSKKSQHFHQGITYNHPDIPLGAHSPNMSSVSSRSTGASRVDLGRSVNFQS